MPDGTTAIALPEHSPLGASSAERWMNCPGSVALARALGPDTDPDPDYRAEGTLAHALASWCLERDLDAWEALGDFPAATSEMTGAVQTYLDYVRRNTPKRRLVEQRVSHTVFHPQMFGTMDCADFDPEPGIALECVDYKHGAGVAVDAIGNVQLRYYAFALISGNGWPASTPRLEDMARIRLTIVQPRGFHPDGPIRSEIVTAGAIRNWAYNELHEAMKRAGEHTFKMGEHCRFCPAKLVCPAMRHLATDAALAMHEIERLPDMSDEWHGDWYGRLGLLKMFIKAEEAEVAKRALAGRTFTTAKLVYGMVDRVWKPDAANTAVGPLVKTFGDDAWVPRKLRSPAQIEALPGGKDFCAEWAEKPKAGLVLAPITDKRAAQKAITNEELFGGVLGA